MLAKQPKFFRKLFPSSLIWEIGETDDVFLTFDDGPCPEVTPWVLDILKEHGAKATFFCLGKNAEQYPDIFRRIVEEGHAVGNHTYSHQKGWEMKTWRYVEDVDFADQIIRSNLLRPPYGRIKPLQAKLLGQRYRLIMWTVVSRDYSRYVSPKKCLKIVTRHVAKGSIIAFHDSKKAFANLSYTLPRFLGYLKENGYRCSAIEL